MNVAIITGASSGIGKEFAMQMDQGFSSIDEFWLIARKEAALKDIAGKLRHKSKIFALDVTDGDQLKAISESLRSCKANVRMLINCAGVGLTGLFEEIPIEEQKNTVRLNCESITELTYQTLPYMQRNARIIMVCSASAFLPQPRFAVYAASKAYALSFSRALGRELRRKGIYVTAVCPGPVATPFLEKSQKNGKSYSWKKYFTAKPKDVASKALRDSIQKKEISVYGASMNLLMVAAKLLPHGMFLHFMK